MNTLFYGFQFQHHGHYSAFWGMKKALLQAGVSVMDVTPPFKRFPEKLQNRLNSRWLMAQEFRLRRHFHKKSPRVFHYYSPENTLFRGGNWKNRHKLVLTSHQPMETQVFQMLLKKQTGFVEGLKQADVVILMASNDIEAYRELAPNAEIISIPYGVDTNFFSPSTPEADQPEGAPLHVLTVGGWLRDYKTWADVVQRCFSEKNNMDFTVIAGKQVQYFIRERLGSDASKIRLVSGISDEQLVGEYDQADILYLPLEDAWANTALLEASSMSLPVLVTDLPATREYLGDGNANFLQKGDADTAWSILVHLGDNRQELASLGKALRKRAIEVNDWSVVARRHLEVYERLLKG
jgi:glycosyltransferase involved in cell wall biosynthesis